MVCLLGAAMGLILLSVGSVFAGTLTGTMEGDMVVNLNLKVNTASSPGTPDFITGDNGDAYIKDQLEVDGNTNMAGNLVVDTNVLYVSSTWNNVSIDDPAKSPV